MVSCQLSLWDLFLVRFIVYQSDRYENEYNTSFQQDFDVNICRTNSAGEV